MTVMRVILVDQIDISVFSSAAELQVTAISLFCYVLTF